MNEQLGKHFEVTLNSVCPNREIPTYADFVNPYGMYEDVLDLETARKFLEVQMEEYNASPGVVRMDLVLFRDALDHICRITRVISQSRGNMLLVGIGKNIDDYDTYILPQCVVSVVINFIDWL